MPICDFNAFSAMVPQKVYYFHKHSSSWVYEKAIAPCAYQDAFAIGIGHPSQPWQMKEGWAG